MGIISLNMGSVGAIPPDGAYPVKVTKSDIGASKDGNSHNWFLRYEILEADDAPEWVGKEIQDLVNIQESTLWRVQMVLEAMTGREWRDDNMDFDPADVVGAELIVEGNEGEYNNQKQFQIKNYYPRNM